MRTLRRPSPFLLALAAFSLSTVHASPTADQQLIDAVTAGNHDAVASALKLGASPDARNEGQTPALVIAASTGNGPAVKALLAAGADPRRQDHTWTPLLAAVLVGDVEMVDRLLAAGAPPNARDVRHTTPLMLAAGLGRTAAVKRLLTVRNIWAEAPDVSGATALHYAANNGQLETVRMLVPRLGPGTKDRDGNTPAMLARRNGFEDVAILLESTPPKKAR